VVENLPTLSQAGTPALLSQDGLKPALPTLSQAGTPALLSQDGLKPALPTLSQAGTPALLSEFALPVELEIEYRESDVDREQGVAEAAMEVHQLVENPAGVFTWRQIPGDHHVDPVKNTVTVPVTDLNPCGSIGTIRVFAVLPAWTIEPIKTYIRPQAGGGGVRIVARLLRQSGADASPGQTGDYRLHQIDIPNYEVTTEDDPERITVEIRQPALLYRRWGVGPLTSFPDDSRAVFPVKTTDASGGAVEFTSPVNVRVQFMDGTKNAYFDLVDFHGVPGLAFQMRMVRDTFVGPTGVDFAFLGREIRQTVNTSAGTVEAFEVTCLTDSTGEGVWGAVVDTGVKPAAARCWEIYE
jgi:hypothetical protein